MKEYWPGSIDFARLSSDQKVNLIASIRMRRDFGMKDPRLSKKVGRSPSIKKQKSKFSPELQAIFNTMPEECKKLIQGKR
jgi:hypothetical protein